MPAHCHHSAARRNSAASQSLFVAQQAKQSARNARSAMAAGSGFEVLSMDSIVLALA